MSRVKYLNLKPHTFSHNLAQAGKRRIFVGRTYERLTTTSLLKGEDGRERDVRLSQWEGVERVPRRHVKRKWLSVWQK